MCTPRQRVVSYMWLALYLLPLIICQGHGRRGHDHDRHGTRVLTTTEEWACNRTWPDLELFLPVNLIEKEHVDKNSKDDSKDWERILFASLQLFWPIEASRVKLVIVVDEEVAALNTPPFQHLKDATVNNSKIMERFSNQISIKMHPPGDVSVWHNLGHTRQQLLQFYADKYTTSEWIGFLDSDCLFVCTIDREDIFENGKAVINGRIGVPQSMYWYQIPNNTRWIMGGELEEPMRCMNYFPIVIKARHLKEFRDFVEQKHQKPFDDVFRAYSETGGFAHYNAMCAFLWYFKKDEYTWYVHETDRTWDMVSNHDVDETRDQPPPIGAVSNRSIFSQEMFLPKPRVAIHLWYHTVKRGEAKPHFVLPLAGFCNSPPWPKKTSKEESVCAQILNSQDRGVYREMHKFEMTDWWNRGAYPEQEQQRLIALLQSERRERLKTCDPPWETLFHLMSPLKDIFPQATRKMLRVPTEDTRP